MMTTMAALMGTLPIALGVGAGAEARRPLGLAVVGGLLVSQLITLYLTPVVYTYMAAFQREGAPLNRRPSAVADAGNGGPLSYSLRSPSAHAVAGESAVPEVTPLATEAPQPEETREQAGYPRE
jgi:hypothetical protein